MKKLIKKLNSKKGFTLVELCVAMGLIAVVAAMVISFSTLSQNQVTTTLQTSDVQGDFVMIDTATKAWLSNIDNMEYEIYTTSFVQDTSKGDDPVDLCLRAYNKNTKKEYRLYFDNGAIVWEAPKYDELGEVLDEPASVRIGLEDVKAISFKVTARRNNNKYYGTALIDIKVNYAVTKYGKTTIGEETLLKTTKITTKRDFVPKENQD